MRIAGFLWLEHLLDKIWHKHNVSQEEVEEVFANSPHIRFVERGLREGEDVYSAQGQTEAGRYLIVFFVHKQDGRALVISAREMTDAERKRYEKR